MPEWQLLKEAEGSSDAVGVRVYQVQIPLYLRPSEGKLLLPFISVSMAVAFEQILSSCSLGPCCTFVIAVLSITLHPPRRSAAFP